MVINGGEREEPENEIYDQFPRGADLPGDDRASSEEGYNTYFRLNDASLFRQEALDEHPVLRAFVDTGDSISISFAMFKSSTRESEWALHKPGRTMDADNRKGPGSGGRLPADIDIQGSVERYPGPALANIATFVINHDNTLARWKQSVVVMEDGARAGQMIYKHPHPEDDPADR
ncbi:MAG: hypothetical protein QOI85_88 [Chloroflexota bacterium]|jgi:hypothetical protein|nr:hypothetical protein [Chloroflexota bacterium]